MFWPNHIIFPAIFLIHLYLDIFQPVRLNTSHMEISSFLSNDFSSTAPYLWKWHFSPSHQWRKKYMSLVSYSSSFSKCSLLPIIFNSASQTSFDFVCFPLPQLPSPYILRSLTSWYQHPLLSGFPCRARWNFWNPNSTMSFPF